jgi:DMSO/TMAO reductase YedYZ molybdopterin-dependent catalytic subunit
MNADLGRRVISSEPYNAETPLEALSGVVPPSELHFVRSHFPIPDHPGSLTIDGEVRKPLSLTLRALHDRPPTTVLTTLECAGNGRAFLDPPVAGEPWRLGAVGTAEWTGVPLTDLLHEAGPHRGAVELLFRGADHGTPSGLGREIAFERSLPVAAASGAIIAYAMNGRPLPPDHGAPLRLVVPGWYGVASVKWLVSVTALSTPFRGFYQVDRYVIGDEPLRLMAPRAVIVSPADGAAVAGDGVEIRGYAWSGATTVDEVDVSVDGGSSWAPASLGPANGHAWRPWEYLWRPVVPGPAVLLARATDARGDVQPLAQVRNALGYRNNAARPVRVVVGTGS